MSKELSKNECLEGLEDWLIRSISRERRISVDEAMKIFYRYKRSHGPYDGAGAARFLDPKSLAQFLVEFEPEMYEKEIQGITEMIAEKTAKEARDEEELKEIKRIRKTNKLPETETRDGL